MAKKRIDILLVERGLAPTRTQAQALIMTGKVLVNEIPVDKAGSLVAEDAPLRVKDVLRYVGRGGLKLERALECFAIDVTDKVCLDVGQSSGGFTDCLLQGGAKKVYGVDVGAGQLHWKLVTDARVVVFERENFRLFDIAKIPEPIAVAVMDVSFISIKLLLPKIVDLFRRDAGIHTLVALIKPQFEVGRDFVGKGGIVRDVAARESVVKEMVAFVAALGFENVRTAPSPITGGDGNVEFLLTATSTTP